MNKIDSKFEILKKYFSGLNSALVAFSAGVDSTFLLKVAHNVLGNNVVAITANTSLFPENELKEAINFCKTEGIKHIVTDLDIFQLPNFCNNPENRCYICKKHIFSNFIEIAKKYNIEHILEGSNIDDDNDYRPGMKAVLELNIKSPLKIAGLDKNEIRILSKQIGLKTADKPSFACLASRLAYKETITAKKLKTIENAEGFLQNIGFKQFRVRLHSDIARIEVLPDEFDNILKERKNIIKKFKSLGFNYITLDLSGYRTGSMNEIIKSQK